MAPPPTHTCNSTKVQTLIFCHDLIKSLSCSWHHNTADWKEIQRICNHLYVFLFTKLQKCCLFLDASERRRHPKDVIRITTKQSLGNESNQIWSKEEGKFSSLMSHSPARKSLRRVLILVEAVCSRSWTYPFFGSNWLSSITQVLWPLQV